MHISTCIEEDEEYGLDNQREESDPPTQANHQSKPTAHPSGDNQTNNSLAFFIHAWDITSINLSSHPQTNHLCPITHELMDRAWALWMISGLHGCKVVGS